MSATLVVSFDTELGWGAIENGRWQRREAHGVYERTRPAVDRLLRVMDELEAPATWAFVGGLLDRGGEHTLDHLPPRRRAAVAAALATGRERTFGGADLIERVHASRVRHEIASHTYSHTRFRDVGVDADVVREELLHARRALARFGEAATLVFPSDEEGFAREVRDTGHTLVRGAPAAGRPASRALALVRAVMVSPPPAVVTEDGGLRRLTGSMLFNSRDARVDRIPFVLLRACRGLAGAIGTGTVFHVWTHPFNFGASAPLRRAFEWFLRRAAAERDRGRLAIRTMAGAAVGDGIAVAGERAS